MPLEKYWKKRKFSETQRGKPPREGTPEPKGKLKKSSGNMFVVQEHKASHLHWDFRLELDGVLKSWAIPKKPPKTRKIKRLAIATEDHPIEYGSWEGTIPEGHYGAGSVKIWDKGTFELIERTDNKIKFELKGKELEGIYELTRFKKVGKDKWLFFKV
ncbi:MAG: 3'-phosphoesterase [Nanoarchaeota archaeon]|nr:3'-phosphoesterase [Nanoarchaeota archaeon]